MLSKYGYLRCQIPRRKRETIRHFRGDRGHNSGVPANPDGKYNPWAVGFELSEEGGSDVCDEVEVQKAIKEYQRTYNLAPTGVLDEETKMLMSTSRCGNKDTEKAAMDKRKENATMTTVTTTTSTPPTSSSSPTPSANVHLSSGAGRSGPYKTLVPDDSNKSGNGAAQRLWKRSANRVRRDDSSALLRLLKGAVSAKDIRASRHHRHVEDYIRRLKRDDPALLRPWTEEDHERAKRSIQVWAVGDAQESDARRAAAANEMFNKEVIRWRLLTTGYSTRIPPEDQRATIDLAFRMWSEVIPLRFIEDTTSDINSVDIEVAFGRGVYDV